MKIHAGIIAAVVLLLGPVPASPAAGPRLTSVNPAASAPGAGLTVTGAGLQRATVRIGGNSATVLKRSARKLVVGVPLKAKPGATRIEVRVGRHKLVKPFRILPRFTGRLGATVDTKRVARGTIGPAGGTVVATGAEGTTYLLRLPAGALASPQAIRVTPVVRFATLPLSGGVAAAARLEPEGLKLAVPGTLTITTKRRWPKSVLAFAGSRALGFEVDDVRAKGKVLVVPVAHFSEHGGASAEANDFARIVQPLVAGLGDLSLSQVRTILDLVAIWDKRFSPVGQLDHKPPTFCQVQPVCQLVFTKVSASLQKLFDARCNEGRRRPALGAVRDLIDLDSDLQGTGTAVNPRISCIEEIARALYVAAQAAVDANPSGAFTDVDLLPPGVGVDIDRDGVISNVEWLYTLHVQFQPLGFPALEQLALKGAVAALAKIRERAAPRCEVERERPVAQRELLSGLAYAQLFAQDEVRAFLTALDACGIGVVVLPGTVSLEPGASKTFVAAVTGAADPGAAAVTWTATGGTITADGSFTAPQQPGSVRVRATSVANPARFGEAIVTVASASCSGTPARATRTGAAPRVDVEVQGTTLQTQAQVDAFGAQHPTTVNGLLSIDSATVDPITTLAPLAGVRQITGGLVIFGAPQLASLDGLCSVESLAQFGLINAPKVSSLLPLAALTRVSSLLIVAGPNLTSLEGLEGVTSLPGGLDLSAPGLTSLNGLQNVTLLGALRIFTDEIGALATFQLPKLQTINSELGIRGSTSSPSADGALRTVSLPALTSVAGDVVVDQASITSFSAPLLAQVGRGVRLNGLRNDLVFDTADTAAVAMDLDVSLNVAGTALTMGLGPVAGDVRVLRNVGLRPTLTVGTTGGSLGLGFCGFGNRQVDFASSSFGAVTGILRIQGNVGFSDTAALSYGSGISAPTKDIRGNVESGTPTC